MVTGAEERAGSGGWSGELDEGSQKLQTSGYKMNKYYINTAVCYL